METGVILWIRDFLEGIRNRPGSPIQSEQEPSSREVHACPKEYSIQSPANALSSHASHVPCCEPHEASVRRQVKPNEYRTRSSIDPGRGDCGEGIGEGLGCLTERANLPSVNSCYVRINLSVRVKHMDSTYLRHHIEYGNLKWEDIQCVTFQSN